MTWGFRSLLRRAFSALLRAWSLELRAHYGIDNPIHDVVDGQVTRVDDAIALIVSERRIGARGILLIALHGLGEHRAEIGGGPFAQQLPIAPFGPHFRA